jgi:hypothetical protein
MKTKFVAGILMVVACLCLLAGEGTSQPPPSFRPTAPAEPAPQFAPADPERQYGGFVTTAPMVEGGGGLEQLVQQLRYVRQQQKALEAQEEELLKRIDLKVEEQRKVLQNADELRKQLRQEKGQVGKKSEPNLPK